MRLFSGFAGIFVVFLASGTQAASFSEIKKRGEIQVATEGSFPPFNFYKGSTLTGFEIDLFNEISKELKLKAKWSSYPFDSLLIGLNQGRYDLAIASHAITEERSKAVDFTEPHYCSGSVILTTGSGPTTVAGLKGKVVGVGVGTSYYEKVKKIPGLKEVKTYPKDTDSVQSLIGGRIDAVVTDKFVALEIIKSTGNKALKIGDFVEEERIAMAIMKGNETLRDALNEALKAVVKSGAYVSVSKKYFPDDIRCK